MKRIVIVLIGATVILFALGHAVRLDASAAEQAPAAQAAPAPAPAMGRGMMRGPAGGMPCPGCGGCPGMMGGPMMGGPMMGGMGMEMMGGADPKTRGEYMQMRGKMMKEMGEWMEKRGAELESGK